MQSTGLLAKAFALVLGMLLVSSMLGTAQHAQARAGAVKPPSGIQAIYAAGSAGKIKPTLREAIVNGGFDLGVLTGWTVNQAGNGSVAVVTTNPYAGNYCAYVSGLNSLYQGFVGIPTSSIQSITYCKRTEPESTTLALQLCYSDGWDEIWEYVTSSWTFFDVTSNLKIDKVLLGIQLPGWTNASGAPMNTYYDNVSILYTPSPTYNVTIDARCNTEGTVVNVGIVMDGSSTGLSSPHTFSGLDGSHTFTVPIADIEGHLFSQWSTGQTSMTITVSRGGTYTAYYSAPALSGNVIRVPEDYRSVQAAIDAASPGSTIVIGPGVYNESVIVNKTLTIIGKLGSEPIFKGGGSGIAITLLPGASGSLIAGIVITSWDEGMLINNASGCKIYDNIMSLMNNCGIALQGNDTFNNFICSNIFQNTTVAIALTTSSHNNTVYRNIITSNDLGVELESGKNLICANSIAENDIGLDLSNSNNSVIYHNNFVNNSVQVSISTSTGNTWDDGYPSGGNHWNDHAGLDLYNGPNQDQLGADGIVDTDYVVAGGGVDRYPLAQPFNAHDVGITDCTILNTVVGGGYTLNVEVKILNYGLYDENFLVTAYANSSVAVTQGVALARSSSIIIALTWNTTGLAYGNYTISVCAGPVAGETNTADDNFTGGWIIVSLVGDITGPIGCPDGKCDMRDVGTVARLFGINYPSPQYNPNYDINSDSKINMVDIGTVARHFGEHYP